MHKNEFALGYALLDNPAQQTPFSHLIFLVCNSRENTDVTRINDRSGCQCWQSDSEPGEDHALKLIH